MTGDVSKLRLRDFTDSVLLLGLFVLNPFLACIYSLYCLSIGRHKHLSVFVVLSFAFLYGYTYHPFETDDLIAHNVIFSQLQNVTSLSEFITYESLNQKPDFLLDYLYWIFGYISHTHQVVGALGATVYYGCMLAVILHWLSIVNVGKSKVAFFILLFMFLAMSPPNEFSGMRQGNANMLFLAIITWPDISMGKRRIWLLLPPIIHFSLIPIVALYYIFSKFQRQKATIVCVVLCLSFFLWESLLHTISVFLPKFGVLGVGLVTKINSYASSGISDGGTLLYAGSRLRFYLQIVLFLIFPLIIKKIYSYRISEHLKEYFIFSIIFWGYMILTSQTHILARTLMLFKFMVCLDLLYIAYSHLIPVEKRSVFKYICLVIVLLGPIFVIQAVEYRVWNPILITGNLISILSTSTNFAGYAL